MCYLIQRREDSIEPSGSKSSLNLDFGLQESWKVKHELNFPRDIPDSKLIYILVCRFASSGQVIYSKQ